MASTPPRVALDFLGCKVNQAEIETLAYSFRQAGYDVTSPEDSPDVYILNSCTVTHVADRKTRLLIHQMAQRNPGALVVVTGCFPSVDPGAVQAIDGVDLIVPNAGKVHLVEIVQQRYPISASVEPTTMGAEHHVLHRTRAMLKVQDGCESFCTYCIVPAARGGVSSLPVAEVVEQVQALVTRGYQEVVLTGVALGSYGKDWNEGAAANALATLLQSILVKTDLRRLRLSSIEPENLDPAMLELWSDERLCRHLHMPLQSGCDATLKRMGRRYRVSDYAALIQRARTIAPDVAVTTDVIVGFPGETEEEFAQSCAFAQTIGFARMHVFRFSARRGTPATRLPRRVQEPVKKERAARMAELSRSTRLAFLRSFIGQRTDVLWEEASGGSPSDGEEERWWTGLTSNYIRVYARSHAGLRNTITPVTMLGEYADGLEGRIAPE